jgi:hypothetical protein
MTRRLLHGLTGLVVLALGLVGLPVFLAGAQARLADLLPSLRELPSTLLAPEDGGLFLLGLLGVGWVCWAVFLVASALEVISRARGVRTPRLGPFLPQRTAAWAITAVTLLASLGPGTATPAPPATPPAVTAPAVATGPSSIAGTPLDTSERPRVHEVADASDAQESAGEEAAVPWRDYHVQRGDTLWDIADEELDDPTQWPAIAEASDEIPQRDGRQLEDPDLILPGWTLHVPRPELAAEENGAPGRVDRPGRGPVKDAQLAPAVEPPVTPLRPSEPADPPATGRGSSAGSGDAIELPETPLRPSAEAAALALPDWVRAPLSPVAFHEAPPETRQLVLAALAARQGASADRQLRRQP